KKQQVLDGDNTLVSQSLINLKKEKEQLEKEISENAILYYPEMAGIVSFETDGLEEIFTTSKLLDYTSKDFKKVKENKKKIENGNSIKVGDPVFKIIDNLEWYMMIKIDDGKEL